MQLDDLFDKLWQQYITDSPDSGRIYNLLTGTGEEIINEIILNTIRDRIHNLKKIIVEIQRLIYKIKNYVQSSQNKPVVLSSVDQAKGFVEVSPVVELLEKYSRKLADVIIEENNGKNKIFKHFRCSTNYISI